MVSMYVLLRQISGNIVGKFSSKPVKIIHTFKVLEFMVVLGEVTPRIKKILLSKITIQRF